MAARAIWKGVLRFGEATVPVKLYSAVEDRSVHFRLLDEKTGTPVKQRMVNPSTGEEVDPERIRKGMEVSEGTFVVLEPEELEEVQPDKSRDIAITRFVDPDVITHQWYDRPYYLGPDEDDEAYFALTEALRRQEKEGVARWVMRNKEYAGALRREGDHLMLITLRHAGEVIPASALPKPAGRAPTDKERAMAEQLIDALAEEFEPEVYTDEYRERILELIQAKAEGRTLELTRPQEKAPTEESLTGVLEKSLAAAKEKRHAA